MKKLILGLIMGVILTWGVQSASQAFDSRNANSNSNVSSFTLRKPNETGHLPQPQFQVLYDSRGTMAGVEYDNQYGQSFLYDRAGQYQGMIQSQPQPVPNRIK